MCSLSILVQLAIDSLFREGGSTFYMAGLCLKASCNEMRHLNEDVRQYSKRPVEVEGLMISIAQVKAHHTEINHLFSCRQ